MLPIAGCGLPGVRTYRDFADTGEMISAAARYRRAVVIGGGLLGLEAANGLRARGMEVTVVHVMPCLMERQLDPVAAGMLQTALEARGILFRLSAQTLSLVPGRDGRVGAVVLADGTHLPAELVVMAVGIRPNIELAQKAGLHCERGIVVDPSKPSTRASTRWGNASRTAASATAWSSRSTNGESLVPLTSRAPASGATRLDTFDPAQGDRHRPVLGGRFMGGAGTDAITLNDAEAGIYRKGG